MSVSTSRWAAAGGSLRRGGPDEPVSGQPIIAVPARRQRGGEGGSHAPVPDDLGFSAERARAARPPPRSRRGCPRRSACEHLLDRLAGNAQLPRDVRLGEPLGDELPDQVAALGRELLRLPRVLERLGPDLPEPVECLLVTCRVL